MFETPSEASFCADLFPAAAYAPTPNGCTKTFNALTPFVAGPKGSGRLVFWTKFSVQIHTEGPSPDSATGGLEIRKWLIQRQNL